ncbi:membrane protein [Labrys miyagiensis]|uniref:Membrane protein n=1 Tax=Labrys miyagiensis TaxID=346912 RepID=A0ABQ6CFL5_9HYPH|nr:HPP family protein [Labrys miyagiensis]GLS17650.1 membrane protein [Labrys miyagiensis]
MPILPSKLFVPILAGATPRDRLFACLGAVIGIGLTGLVCTLVFGRDPHLPYIVAPVGASAVLLFAVPASPLAQPWSIVGGNTLSALAGIIVCQFVHEPLAAIGLAVGLAIAVMSLTRCLHPPGGAAALTAVIGGPAVAAAGFSFALIPVGLNSLLLVALGWLFHRFSRHAYPHVSAPLPASTHGTRDSAPSRRVGFRAEDVDAALEDIGEAFDIDRQDLDRLLRRVEERALLRSHGDIACADIMSRDVITVGPETELQAARNLMLDHNIRTLPVVDATGRLAGTVGLRELARLGERVGEVMRAAVTATPGTPALSLIPRLTDGSAHAVVIVLEEGRVAGLVTQTDLLAATARLAGSADVPTTLK